MAAPLTLPPHAATRANAHRTPLSKDEFINAPLSRAFPVAQKDLGTRPPSLIPTFLSDVLPSRTEFTGKSESCPDRDETRELRHRP